MTQTLVVVVLFVGAIAMLPWLVRRIQQRQGTGGVAAGGASRVVSTVAVGPQQRVVTVEVGPDHARTWLVLGVTAQSVNCLHAQPFVPVAQASTAQASFAQEMAVAVTDTGKASNV
ncbi:MAG: flagellar biosynthetic protein FliO [Gammaproteobacteria bacterium]|nr:flagellar biosynthetic protein FliO [Gammaproteobacteria bacterium]MBU1818419.1 flagellar biosynthetic protein FliO [Gammaproteobacteria bacterium]